MKKGKLIALLLAAALLLSGCGGTGSAQVSGTVTYEEMTITMPVGFVKLSDQEHQGMVTFTYGSEDMLIVGTREPMELLLGEYPDMTLESYAQMIIDSNSLDCQAQDQGGYLTFSFDVSDEEQTYRYLAAVYESDQSFWVIQAGCEVASFPDREESFRQCLASVEMAPLAD